MMSSKHFTGNDIKTVIVANVNSENKQQQEGQGSNT